MDFLQSSRGEKVGAPPLHAGYPQSWVRCQLRSPWGDRLLFQDDDKYRTSVWGSPIIYLGRLYKNFSMSMINSLYLNYESGRGTIICQQCAKGNTAFALNRPSFNSSHSNRPLQLGVSSPEDLLNFLAFILSGSYSTPNHQSRLELRIYADGQHGDRLRHAPRGTL